MHIRQAAAADDRVIKQLVREARINPFQLDWRRFLLVVEDGGRVVGCAQVKTHGDGSRELASLVVSPERRRQGLARQLIQRLMAEYGGPLYLTCRSELEPFYRKFGFYWINREQMSPYFRKLSGLANILLRLAGGKRRMAVMRWDG